MNEIVKVADKNKIMSKDYFLAMLLFFFPLTNLTYTQRCKFYPFGCMYISFYIYLHLQRRNVVAYEVSANVRTLMQRGEQLWER